MDTEAAVEDVRQVPKVRKLAALLIMLGPDSAAQLLKSFDARELEAVSIEMARLPVISQDLQQEVLREFGEVAVEASTALLGGVNVARATLEKSIGSSRASDILSRVAPAPVPASSLQQLTDLDHRQLFNLLKQEQPQTIALIVSYLTSDKSSQLMGLFPGEVRDEVISRLATLAPTPIDVVERIVAMLAQKAGTKSTRAMNQTGGLKNAADILNALDKKISASVLTELEKRNPELGQAIRQKMFTFEDLGLLDNASLQKVMREVDMRDLAVGLKTAAPKLKTTLLAAITKRAAATVNEEISFLGNLKKKEIEASQLRIIERVRQLEAEGELDLSAVTNPNRDEVLA